MKYSPNLEKYIEMVTQLINLRKEKGDDSEEVEKLENEMDILWFKLTSVELVKLDEWFDNLSVWRMGKTMDDKEKEFEEVKIEIYNLQKKLVELQDKRHKLEKEVSLLCLDKGIYAKKVVKDIICCLNIDLKKEDGNGEIFRYDKNYFNYQNLEENYELFVCEDHALLKYEPNNDFYNIEYDSLLEEQEIPIDCDVVKHILSTLIYFYNKRLKVVESEKTKLTNNISKYNSILEKVEGEAKC